jgi:hypothetical protein
MPNLNRRIMNSANLTLRKSHDMSLDDITGARVQRYARYSFKVGYAD